MKENKSLSRPNLRYKVLEVCFLLKEDCSGSVLIYLMNTIQQYLWYWSPHLLWATSILQTQQLCILHPDINMYRLSTAKREREWTAIMCTPTSISRKAQRNFSQHQESNLPSRKTLCSQLIDQNNRILEELKREDGACWPHWSCREQLTLPASQCSPLLILTT
jgi:hypothetical protein